MPSLAGACQSTSAAPIPAAFDAADPGDMARVKAVLSKAVGRARIKIGPSISSSPAISSWLSTIAVLPPPLNPNEDRSTAAPTIFDIYIQDGACYAVKRETGEAYALTGVACTPLED